jgi:hypothetical protein
MVSSLGIPFGMTLQRSAGVDRRVTALKRRTFPADACFVLSATLSTIFPGRQPSLSGFLQNPRNYVDLVAASDLLARELLTK